MSDVGRTPEETRVAGKKRYLYFLDVFTELEGVGPVDLKRVIEGLKWMEDPVVVKVEHVGTHVVKGTGERVDEYVVEFRERYGGGRARAYIVESDDPRGAMKRFYAQLFGMR